MIAWVGWLATAVFAISYFVPKISTLTKIQAAAACLWIIYGMKIGAAPVIAANLIVAAAALYSSYRNRESNTPKDAL
jgi:hypothetical protein